MKISKLIATHHAIIQQARLANLAQAYLTLRRCAERVRRAQLCGLVNLRQPDAGEGRMWASLTALEGRQSVLEEHFCDEELMEFADAVAFARSIDVLDIEFRLEALMTEFVVPLEAQLKQAGVDFDLEAESPGSHGDGFLSHDSNHRRGGAPNQR
jgi:hypothetical protein